MAVTGTCLILSIRREHAQRIFEGSKVFELRKRLPNREFKRVYMYETGGGGIIGCFDPLRIIREKKSALWDRVSYHATTKARFERYFERSTDGFAIEVSKPLKFRDPISLSELRAIDPRFHVPMSSRALPLNSRLGQFFEAARRLSRRRQSPEVILVPIGESERARYQELVLKHISARYDGIDETFAGRTLQVHDIGHDPAGFFTDRKEVFSIWRRREHARKEHIGFTTVTWKNNGCAKTGPTIVETKYQHRGFGRASRIALECLIRNAKFRKIYCTCADNASDVVAYLLDSGMKIEAHLDRQYSSDHGEFVFGKFLVADEYEDIPLAARRSVKAHVIDPSKVEPSILKKDFKHLFERAWTPISDEFADRVIKDGISRKKPDPRFKAKRIVCIGSSRKIEGITVLLPKRGGSVKALMATDTNDYSSLEAMIEEVSLLSCRWGARKIYFLHPLLDHEIIRALRSSQYQMEGFLKAPYRPGQDIGIFSRFC